MILSRTSECGSTLTSRHPLQVKGFLPHWHSHSPAVWIEPSRCVYLAPLGLEIALALDVVRAVAGVRGCHHAIAFLCPVLQRLIM